eukprot:CAMPEP_0194756922 /NCGR_PEP_ID=MMETSP0323_2-20130528/10532_1 /TAXON_ID=2866 ORGANISM="Crypthecodinium cohnii, Strain Seligo" /NCGR_SAMPLE_ID=MMETSP0323_2 /ASSEMBLY_ACC=CAM_ASM_000346 /LENGTH=134 /DNA_ID=CAMNT_0039676651 /DNA_START=663 /DNA_END=1068 /DNA_ORIENTATION=-
MSSPTAGCLERCPCCGGVMEGEDVASSTPAWCSSIIPPTALTSSRGGALAWGGSGEMEPEELVAAGAGAGGSAGTGAGTGGGGAAAVVATAEADSGGVAYVDVDVEHGQMGVENGGRGCAQVEHVVVVLPANAD